MWASLAWQICKHKNKSPTNKPAQTTIFKHRFSLVAVSEAHWVLHYPLHCHLMLAIHSCPLYLGHAIEPFSCTFPGERPVTSIRFLKSLQMGINKAASLGLPLSTQNHPEVPSGWKGRARKASPAAHETSRDFPQWDHQGVCPSDLQRKNSQQKGTQGNRVCKGRKLTRDLGPAATSFFLPNPMWCSSPSPNLW